MYDLEIQRANAGADVHRARYHASCMDVENLDEGQDYDELPETNVIFITENDLFKKGIPFYPIERINMMTDEPFSDDEHILYVNGSYRDNTAIGMLMHDFCCSDPDDMHDGPLQDAARYYKEDLKGVSYMCTVFDEVRMEAEARGKAEGIISACKALGSTIEQAIGMFVSQLGLTQEQAAAEVKRLWV